MVRSKSKIGAVLALLAALSVPAGATAQTTLAADNWFSFDWSGLGPVSQTFLATTTTLLVVDCCLVGDMFEVFVNGSSIGSTSYADPNSGSSVSGGAEAYWASTLVSKGFFTVGIGDLITLSVTQLATGYTTGEGYIQSTTRSVPEPGSVLLIASGLLGMAFVRRRNGAIWSA